jgi:hypothetical protein
MEWALRAALRRGVPLATLGVDVARTVSQQE